MSVDILNMRRFDVNEQAIDVALPVLAIECEATPPQKNHLDAYEEAVLKLVSLGLSKGGISKTLNATESLIEEILSHLENENYVSREIGRPWKLTEKGEEYLGGTNKETNKESTEETDKGRMSAESQFGYMFINAIKKEVLPYFYQGDVGQISLFRGMPLPLKLTIEGDEVQTFAPVKIKNSKLKKSYKAYFRNINTSDEYREGEISKEEAIDIFADEDLDSLDEASDEDSKDRALSENIGGKLNEKMFIRALKKPPAKLYLRMRIIIDPSYPGGYRAESPFDFSGIDDNYFLKQIQWLEQSKTAYIDDEIMQDFLHREICKISPSYNTTIKDFGVFILERMPLLKLYRSRFPYVYEDMERIYALMQRQTSLLEKENIVNNLARCVVEGLFNSYFRSIDPDRLSQIKQKAIDDVATYGHETYKQVMCRYVKLDKETLNWVSPRYLNTILSRLTNTFGNSIMEKFINMLVIECHLSDAQIKRYLNQDNIGQKYNLIDKLNRIRRKVSHDTDDKFTNEDYEFYMSNVFGLINGLLEGLREEL